MPKSPRIVPEYCSRLWALTRFSFIWYHILGSRVPFWGNQGLYSIIKSQYSCSWTLDTVAPLFSMKWCINSVHGVSFPAFSHTVIPVYLSEVLSSSLSFSFRFPIQAPVVDFTDLSRSVCETSDLKTLKNGMYPILQTILLQFQCTEYTNGTRKSMNQEGWLGLEKHDQKNM